MSTDDLALAQLIAAAAWGQLAGAALTAAVVPLSPDVQVAEELADLADREYDRWRVIRGHLATLTDLPEALLTRQRPLFDEFFEGATDHGWEHACAVLAFGWSIANDFLHEIAPSLPERTRVVLDEIADNHDVERFALAQLRERVTTAEDRERMRAIVADLLGRALAGFQRAMQDTDALEVLLDSDAQPGVASRQFAIDLLSRHRSRLAELGIDDPD